MVNKNKKKNKGRKANFLFSHFYLLILFDFMLSSSQHTKDHFVIGFCWFDMIMMIMGSGVSMCKGRGIQVCVRFFGRSQGDSLGFVELEMKDPFYFLFITNQGD
jgi:hypothetical protein